MNHIRRTASLAVALVAMVFAVGCHSSSEPAPTDKPDAAALPGLPVNNPWATGVAQAEMHIIAWSHAADATGDASTAETAVATIGPGPLSIPIATAYINSSATLTASDTNNATISIYKRNSPDAGATAQTLIASIGTGTTIDAGSGNWNSFQPIPMNVVAGAFVSPGDCITATITKTLPNGGAGVIVPQANIALFTNIQ